MYITPQELKIEVRALRSDIASVAKDLGGDVQFLYQKINQLEELLEVHQQTINKINEAINGNSK